MISALAAAPGAARAETACGTFSAGAFYWVGAGQSCSAPAGAYTPTSGPALQATGGGVLITQGAVTITEPNAANALGIYATDAGSSINATAGQTVTTSGANAPGVSAQNGGLVLLGQGLISATGASQAAYVNGAGSTIQANETGFSAAGDKVHAVLVNGGAGFSATGGTLTTSGTWANAIEVQGSGASANLTGTTITTTGAGSTGASLVGTGSSLRLTSVTITTTGGDDTADGTTPGGVFNGSAKTGLYPGGGVLTVTTSSITTNAANTAGIGTSDGGATNVYGGLIVSNGASTAGLYASGSGTTVTAYQINGASLAIQANGANDAGANANAGAVLTLNGVQIASAASATNAAGVIAQNGGTANVNGGTITVNGTGSAGLRSTGTGSVLNAGGGYAVNVTAAGSNAVETDSGGSVKLTGGTLTVAGAGSGGIYATGAGTQVNASNLVIATSGNLYATAIDADSGATVTIQGGAETTSGLGSYVAGSTNAGVLQISGATLTGTGAGGGGLFVNGAGSSVTGANLTIQITGGVDTTDGIGAAGATNQSYLNSAGGGGLKLTNSSITVGAAGGDGVYTSNAGVTTLNTVQIATAGVSSYGVQSQTGGATTMTGGSIATTGIGGDGVYGDGGSTTNLSGVAIATAGDGAKGVSIHTTGTSFVGSNLTIATAGTTDANGNNAEGVFNGGGGTASTVGGGTVTLTNSSVTTSGVFATGVATQDGGVTTLNGDTVKTTGASASAVSLIGTGSVTLNGGTLTTTGDGSTGLVINGPGGSISAANLTISTGGGIYAANGSHADGVYSGSFGSNTGGGALTLTDSKVTTGGNQANGVSAGAGGTVTVYGSSISTSGAQATAALASNGGKLTLSPDFGGAGAQVSTSGVGSYAAVANSGGTISINGATLATTANGAGGLGVNGTGSEIDAANTTISTAGALDAASGLHAYGAYNGPNSSFTSGGVLNLNNVTISTQGAGMYGVYSNTGGVTTYTVGTVTTAGAGAHGLYAGGGGRLDAENVTVSTSGQGAYGAYVGGGGTLTLGNEAKLSTSGANANALDVSGAGSTATLNGNLAGRNNFNLISILATGANSAGVSVDSGGAVTIYAADLTSAADGVVVAGGGSASSVSAPGPIYVATTGAGGAAIRLTGDGATFNGTGGGIIVAAGQGMAFLNGVNQTASFTNYNIQSAGDLIYADPSTATVNFTNTEANAGSGNLLNATNQSDITINAIASTLFGAIQTDATSTTNVNLGGGTTWTVTGNSTVSSLSVNGSAVAFAPSASGAFKTLTVGNYAGAGATMTFNASLAGPVLGSDQLVINGGKATGSTLVSIHAVPDPPGPNTPLSGTPLITTTNGGTIAPGAFTLAGPVAANGFVYTLQQTGAGETLIANQGLTPTQATNSLSTVAQAKQAQAVTSRVLGSILTGATEQINCTSCSSGFASFGSFALGLHGRWTLSPSLALLAGGSYDSYSDRGVRVNNSLQLALAARYDMVQLGRYRPFFEAGVATTPYANISYTRSIVSSLAPATATGDALSRSVAVYGRAGYIWRVTPRDEVAAYTDLSRSWESDAGYTETTSGLNPFTASVAPSLDTLNVWRVGAQYTHLFGEHIEANVSAGFAEAFDASYGNLASVNGFGLAGGTAPADFNWVELGGRLSYRFSRNVTADAFVLGTLGAEPVGNQIHGGLALRLAF